MKLNVPEPTYYTFEQLANKWGTKEEIIENYLLTDVIKKCEIVPNVTKSPTKERNRISRLMIVLNDYACDKIRDELATKFVPADDGYILSESIHTDITFRCWINYKEYDLDKIVVVIPIDEVNRLETEWRVRESVGTRNHMVKEIVKQSAVILYNINSKWPQYSNVLNHINNEASKDGQVGSLIQSSGKNGIHLTNDDIIKVKTVRNWLTDFKKQIVPID